MDSKDFIKKWYDEARITDADEKDLLGWLAEQTPDDWHVITANWNYDSNNAALKYIVSHPECDMGTAIQLFLTDAPNWAGYKREDIKPYYHDAFDTVKIARERLFNQDFINKELVPLISYSPSEINPTYPPVIGSYKGVHEANSNFISQDGTIYLSQKAFAEKIGVDYATIYSTPNLETHTQSLNRPSNNYLIISTTIALIILAVFAMKFLKAFP